MKYSILVIVFGFMFSGLTLAESGGKNTNIKNHKTSHQVVKAPVRSNLVLQIQHQLNRLGFNAGRADGIMGKQTSASIKAFQRSHHDHIDGKASSALLEKLRRAKKR